MPLEAHEWLAELFAQCELQEEGEQEVRLVNHRSSCPSFKTERSLTGT
jgi:hypothetical protein